MKKGDILKFEDYKNRGLVTNCYFYCKGLLEDEPLFVRCIITQSGDLLLSEDFTNIDSYKKDLVLTTVEEFLDNKFNFKEASLIKFKNKKYEIGIIRSVCNKTKTLEVEVEGKNYNYVDIKINFDDVEIVYPEFTFNDRRNFLKIS